MGLATQSRPSPVGSAVEALVALRPKEEHGELRMYCRSNLIELVVLGGLLSPDSFWLVYELYPLRDSLIFLPPQQQERVLLSEPMSASSVAACWWWMKMVYLDLHRSDFH